MTKASSEVTSVRMKMGWGDAAVRQGPTLDSAVKECLSEEATLMEELALWGSGGEYFRSGYSKCKGPAVGRRGRS